MPVITFKYQDLKDLGIDMEKDELINTLPMMSSDIEDFDDEEIKVEFFPNRPDNLSVEGVARSFKGFIGQETGLPEYEITESGEEVVVEMMWQKSDHILHLPKSIMLTSKETGSNISWIFRKTSTG